MKTISKKTIGILALSLAMLCLIMVSTIRFFESEEQYMPKNDFQSVSQEYVVYENELYKIKYPSRLTDITKRLEKRNCDLMLANLHTGYAVSVNYMPMSGLTLEDCIAWKMEELKSKGAPATINKHILKGEVWYEMMFEGVVNDIGCAFVSYVTAKKGTLFDLQFSSPGTFDDLRQYKEVINQIVNDFEIQ